MEPETPVVETPQKTKINGLTIALIILLVAALGLGTSGFLLNSNLTSTRSTHAALQKEHDKLTSDTKTLTSDLEKAKADLEKAKADLEKAKKDLATSQSDLTKSNDAITGHQSDITKAKLYLDFASAFFIDRADLTALDAKIAAVKDPKLMEKFDAYSKGGSETEFINLMYYLFKTIADLLK